MEDTNSSIFATDLYA